MLQKFPTTPPQGRPKRYTEKEVDLYNYICQYFAEFSMCPSIREMMAAVGFSSTSVTNYSVGKLVDGGYLLRDENREQRQFIPVGAEVIYFPPEQTGPVVGEAVRVQIQP